MAAPKDLLGKLIADPAKYYRNNPQDIPRDRRLSTAQRKSILDAWEKILRSASIGRAEQLALDEIDLARDEIERVSSLDREKTALRQSS